MTDLSGKVAVVTGSARGIGKAVALRYTSLRASVVINCSADEDNARLALTEVEKAGGRGIVVRANASCLVNAARLLSDGGRLISVGSSTTLSPYPGTGLYASSKTARPTS